MKSIDWSRARYLYATAPVARVDGVVEADSRRRCRSGWARRAQIRSAASRHRPPAPAPRRAGSPRRPVAARAEDRARRTRRSCRARRGARRQAPDRQAEVAAGEAALDDGVGAIVARRGSSARSASSSSTQRRHQRLEHAAAPRRHVAHAAPLVVAGGELVAAHGLRRARRRGVLRLPAAVGGKGAHISNQCRSGTSPLPMAIRLPSRASV